MTTGQRAWTADDIRKLGAKTDLVTACAATLGCGRNKAWELYHSGQLPFPAIKVGRRVVCPTAPLRKLLAIEDDAASRREGTADAA